MPFGFQPFEPFGAPVARRAATAYVPPEEFEDPDFLDTLAGTGMSALQWLGETLDKPGRAVRGLLAGKPYELLNLMPFSDTLGVTDPAESVGGRDLLEQYGVLDPNTEGLDGGDVAGFAADVLLDPTTYLGGLGLFGKGLTASGKVAKKLGKLPGKHLFDDAGKLTKGWRAAQREAGGFAKHVAPHLDDVTRPIAEEAAKKAGTTLDDLMQSTDPLARGGSWWVPFVGSGTYDLPFGASDKLAGAKDWLGAGIRSSKLGVVGKQLFGRKTGGANTFASQEAFEEAFDASEAAKAKRDTAATSEFQTLRDAGVALDPDSSRRLAERTDDGLTAPLGVDKAVMRNLGPEEPLSPFAEVSQRWDRGGEFLPGGEPGVRPSDDRRKWLKLGGERGAQARQAAAAMSDRSEDIRLLKEAEGLEARAVEGSKTAYSARFNTDPNVVPAGIGAGPLFDTRDLGARDEWTKQVPGGAATIDAMLRDPKLKRLTELAEVDPLDPQQLVPPKLHGPFEEAIDEAADYALVPGGKAALSIPDVTRPLPGAFLEDTADLTKTHASQIRRLPEDAISRTVPLPRPKDNLKLATEYAAKRYFGWTDERFRQMAENEELVKAIPDLRLDVDALNVAAAELGPQLDVAKHAKELADAEGKLAAAQAAEPTLQADKDALAHVTSAVGSAKNRPKELFASPKQNTPGARRYANDAYVDAATREHHDLDAVHYARALNKVASAGAKAFNDPAEMRAAGFVPITEYAQATGRGNTPEAMTNFLKAFVPQLGEKGIIPPDVVDNIVGKHPVATSGVGDSAILRAAQQAFDEGKLTKAKLDVLTKKIPIPNDGLIKLQTIGVPQDVVDLGTRASKWLAGGGGPDGPLAKAGKSFTSWWKAHVTSEWPAFANRNLMSLFWQGLVVGAQDNRFGALNPKTYIQPWKDMHALLKGDVVAGAAEMPMFKGRKLTDAQATDALRSIVSRPGIAAPDVTHADLFDDEAAKQLPRGKRMAEQIAGEVPVERPGILGTKLWKQAFTGLKNKGGKNPFNVKTFAPTVAGGKVNAYYERLGRGATVLGLMRQGYAPEEAIRIASEAHVNYRTLSPTERTIKQFVPFYSYTSRAVPWTLEHLMDNPAGMVRQAIRAEDAAASDSGFLPPQVAGGAAIKLGPEAKGIQRFLTGLDLPFESINDVAQFGRTPMDTVSKTFRANASQLNPLITTPLEIAFGKSLFQGREIRDLESNLGRTVSNVLGMDDPAFKPGLFDTVASKLLFPRHQTTLRQLTDPRKGVLAKGTNLFTGARVSDVDMDKAVGSAAAEEVRNLARDLGAKEFPEVFFTAESLERMSPADREKAEKTKKLMAEFARRGRQRAKERREKVGAK